MSQKLDKTPNVISKMFTSLAPRYDLMNDVMTGFTHHHTRKFALELIREKQIDRILDLASGTGDFAFLLNNLLKSETVIIGCDFSRGMLEIARHRLQTIQNVAEKKLAFFCSDINHLPFSDKIFDVCSIIYGLRNVQDPLGVLHEIYRLTKPNGRLVIVEANIPLNPIIRFLLSFYFKKIVPIIASLFASNVQAYDYYFKSVEQFIAPIGLLKLLKKSNWNQVTINRLLFDTVIVYEISKK
ncbi:MAG: ubiquinone/menaquinone biosynthesis methyltransferase [Candidatus Hodarchaeales archaeon]|jgi:demethylmenaquinone methyltransferase/2-methoxy-6-polyprenyl-1,4-benzoquinol methylase